jgi:IPT/TIG domain-containing protein
LTVTSPAGSGVVDVRVTFAGGGMTPAVAADKYSYAPQVTGISPTSGSHNGGTKVTISGTNFTGVPATGAVKFGTTSATYTVNKNGTITATSPPGTVGTSVDVTVTSPGGTSASSPTTKFTYN